MANFLKDIKEVLGSEIPEAVKFLSLLDSWYIKTDPRNIGVEPVVGKIITWEQAQPLLDYDYDSGFGTMDCHDIYIWTKDSVFYIHEYDGSTQPVGVPRSPKI